MVFKLLKLILGNTLLKIYHPVFLQRNGFFDSLSLQFQVIVANNNLFFVKKTLEKYRVSGDFMETRHLFRISEMDDPDMLQSLKSSLIKETDGTVTLQIPDSGETETREIAAVFRQMLLSRVPGWAVTRLRIDYGRQDDNGNIVNSTLLHKYSYLPGVVENVRDIISNLRRGIFRLPENEKALSLQCEFSIDIAVSSHYKELLMGEFFDEDQNDVIITPEHKVLTFHDMGFHIRMNIDIESGLGFKTSEEVKRNETERTQGNPDIFTLTLDADFNPVKKAGYDIRPGEIEFRLETNGAVSPAEACQHVLKLMKEESARNEDLK